MKSKLYTLWSRIKCNKDSNALLWVIEMHGEYEYVKKELEFQLGAYHADNEIKPSLFKISDYKDTSWIDNVDENLYYLKKGINNG